MLYLTVGFVSVILLTFLLRALPGYLSEELYAADDAFHMYFVDEIRRNNHKLPDQYSRIIPPTQVNYPPLMHWMLSYLPGPAVKKVVPYYGALMDSVHNAVVMVFAFWVFTQSGGVPPGLGALSAGFVFAVTPILVLGRPMTARLRLSARPFGALLVSISVLSTVVWLTNQQPVFLVVAVIAATLTLLSSMFSTQALVVLFAGLTVASGDGVLVAAIGSAFVLALVLSLGRYWRSFKCMVGGLVFFWKYYETRRAGRFKKKILNVSRVVLRRRPVRELFPGKPSDAAMWVYTHELLGMYIQLPFLVVLLFWFTVDTATGVQVLLLGLVASVLIANLVIAVPGVIGKPAYRYAEYFVPALSVLAVHAFFTVDVSLQITDGSIATVPLMPVLAAVVLLYSLAMIAVNVAAEVLIGTHDGLYDAINWLKQKDETANVLSVPGRYGQRLLSMTHHNVIVTLTDSFASPEGRRERGELFVDTTQVTLIDERYGADYLLVNKGKLTENPGLIDVSLNEPNWVFEEGDFGVYEYRRT